MMDNFETTWETYTSSWTEQSIEKKRVLFEQTLDLECEYHDPLVKTKTWDELLSYMLDFHRQIPGGYFVTKYFLAHHQQCISKWEMRNSNHVVIGEGISYGKFNDAGKLIGMTGFYETP